MDHTPSIITPPTSPSTLPLKRQANQKRPTSHERPRYPTRVGYVVVLNHGAFCDASSASVLSNDGEMSSGLDEAINPFDLIIVQRSY